MSDQEALRKITEDLFAEAVAQGLNAPFGLDCEYWGRQYADRFEAALEAQLAWTVEALRVADDLLRRFSISANDHSELIRREFGKAQRQINDALGPVVTTEPTT